MVPNFRHRVFKEKVKKVDKINYYFGTVNGFWKLCPDFIIYEDEWPDHVFKNLHQTLYSLGLPKNSVIRVHLFLGHETSQL